MNKKQSFDIKDPTAKLSPIIEQEPPKKRISTKKTVALFISILLLGGLAMIGARAFTFVKVFSNSTNTDPLNFIQVARDGWNSDQYGSNNRTNILVLGLDQNGDQNNDSILTDSIIFTSISKDGVITLVSVPRDLWIDPLKTKINALFYYGEKSENTSGIELVRQTIEEITGQEIDHTLVLSLNQVKEVIDIIGGITVTVDNSFTDANYPKEGVPPDILPVELRYETISFNQGEQKFDGTTALKFIRSRQSQDQQEGTDGARSKRQQKVILGIISKLSDRRVLGNPDTLASLYNLWHNQIATSLSDDVLVGLGRHQLKNQIIFDSQAIPVKDATSSGILYNPPLTKYNQWVYVPYDSSWEQFQKFFSQILN